MLRYYITDRHMLGGIAPLIENIKSQIAARVDYIQLREKDLSTPELLALARQVIGLSVRTTILINSRLDVALAAGAHGIHLPSNSPSPSFYKRVAPQLIVGVSCHNRAELLRAATEGADYAVLGPVFAPLSKPGTGVDLGLGTFAELRRAVNIPVIALGGITNERIPACMQAGASGVAGISLFQGYGVD